MNDKEKCNNKKTLGQGMFVMCGEREWGTGSDIWYCEKCISSRNDEYAKACIEWLKGCSNSIDFETGDKLSPRECVECTDAFLDRIEKI